MNTQDKSYVWTTLSNGLVEVNGQLPALTGFNLLVFKTKVLRWEELAIEYGNQFSVPDYWILGIIFTESHGFPKAISPDKGYGLMQITSKSLFEGHDPKETLDKPELNIYLGTKFLSRIMKSVPDLPRVASCYNAGMELNGQPHSSSKSPWGFRETTGYISRVVAASNSAVYIGIK